MTHNKNLNYEIQGDSPHQEKCSLAWCECKGIAYMIMQCMKQDYAHVIVIEHVKGMQKIVFG